MAPQPDVTVIVPVYNTMPYLTACLDSLVGQSLERGRLHVVAVDDGSTDGGEAELGRYADRHPELFTVVHQANSGGPAAPCNRGLELATGRFVFFLGSDDYLAECALEKLVAKADEWDSDVIFGRMVGVGGRKVSQRLFQHDDPDVAFPHSPLPFALANTKLFRRSLVEEHRIRYALDLRIGSDQPFTIEAMLRARRISVLTDEPYYFAVRRHDAANISFSVGSRPLVQDIGTVMHHVAELLAPGEDRDAVLHRHFAWEISKQLGPAFLELEPRAQDELMAAVGRLADAYLTDGLSRRLEVGARLRIRLAQTHRLAELKREIEFLASAEEPVLALGAEGPSLVHPGFGELPADWFVATADALPTRVLRDVVRLTGLAWDEASLVLDADVRLHPLSAGQVRVALVKVGKGKAVRAARRFRRGKDLPGHSWPVTLVPAPATSSGGTSADGSRLHTRLDLGVLLDQPDGPGRRWALRFHLDVGEHTHDLPAEGAPGAATRVRVGARFLRLVARRDDEGRIFVLRRPVPLKKVLQAETRRRLSLPHRPA